MEYKDISIGVLAFVVIILLIFLNRKKKCPVCPAKQICPPEKQCPAKKNCPPEKQCPAKQMCPPEKQCPVCPKTILQKSDSNLGLKILKDIPEISTKLNDLIFMFQSTLCNNPLLLSMFDNLLKIIDDIREEPPNCEEYLNDMKKRIMNENKNKLKDNLRDPGINSFIDKIDLEKSKDLIIGILTFAVNESCVDKKLNKNAVKNFIISLKSMVCGQNSSIRIDDTEEKPEKIRESKDLCDKTKCNNTMRNYIVDKYWAFNNSTKTFPSCTGCPSRSFKDRNQVEKNGIWSSYASKQEAYEAAKLI